MRAHLEGGLSWGRVVLSASQKVYMSIHRHSEHHSKQSVALAYVQVQNPLTGITNCLFGYVPLWLGVDTLCAGHPQFGDNFLQHFGFELFFFSYTRNPLRLATHLQLPNSLVIKLSTCQKPIPKRNRNQIVL